MNKYVAILSAAAMGLALTACGNNGGQESAPAAAPAASTPMAAPAASTAMAAPAAGTSMKAPAAGTGKPASPTPPQN